MSLAPVNAALDDLLAGDTAQAVALKGEWGRGKSYFWRSYLASHGALLARSETYSYVSLFSLDSLSAVKEAIFANAESLKARRRSPSN
jgi:tRNA A37 threonylcarbamoyladenosine biosynthesis protein TsaE